MKVLCRGKAGANSEDHFKESTTLGVRIHEETRRVLQRLPGSTRMEVTVKTGYAGPETLIQLAPGLKIARIASETGTL